MLSRLFLCCLEDFGILLFVPEISFALMSGIKALIRISLDGIRALRDLGPALNLVPL